MSNKNDEIFAKFAVLLAKKILERQDASDAFAEEQANQYNLMMAAQFSLGNIPNQYRGVTLYTADFASIMNPVSADELAVIRAYCNGEDVLTTILSQER
ncbi:hypothetical protein [Rhizobium skierniewicense]|uniref:hypothetical protein n=1 Tax=Rhizobium skierniewicense TaxID=984260 RepID=UPI0015722F5F|nr:hypothetical protein [Rhizobium skierniewicense]NTF34271.1 hypothetical protein [Rhizobium skierniewicense]